MKFRKPRDPISSAEARLNAEHPILGNFHLPVEIEGAQKRSGVHNLSREGWDEEKCRDFLVRVLGHVPRNYNYGDGLRIIHPKLQERFGDENMDLACGVLEELIEVESPPPFPSSVYQRWKHKHKCRHEDFQLPHAPHTRTIMAPVQPTSILKEWRAQNAPRHQRVLSKAPPHSVQNSTCVSPISPTFAAAHIDPSFRIENSMYISMGGQRASVYSCPTPTLYHKRLWDEQWGRGGKLIGKRTISMTSIQLNGERVQIDFLETGDETDSQQQARGLSPDRYTKDLLSGNLLPNAVFARKYQVIPDGQMLPDWILNRPTRLSPDGLFLQQCEELCNEALVLVSKLPGVGNFHENDAKELEMRAMDAFIQTWKGPHTPGLFFDSGLDYKWDIGSRVTRANLSDPNQYTWVGNITKPRMMYEEVSTLRIRLRCYGRRILDSASSSRTYVAGLVRQMSTLPPGRNSYRRRSGNGVDPMLAKLEEVAVAPDRIGSFRNSSILKPLDNHGRNLPDSGHIRHRPVCQVTPKKSKFSFFKCRGAYKQAAVETEADVLTDVDVSTEMNKANKFSTNSESTNSLFILPSTTFSPHEILHEGGGITTRESAAVVGNWVDSPPVDVSVMSWKPRKVQDWRAHRMPQKYKQEWLTLDGAVYDSDLCPDNKQLRVNAACSHNLFFDESNSALATSNSFMDLDQGLAQLQAPSSAKVKPLHVRKQSSRFKLARSQQHLSDNQPCKDSSEAPIYPPRTSSIRNHHRSYDPETFQLYNTRSSNPSTLVDTEQSTLSSCQGLYDSDTSIEAPSTVITTDRSTISSYKARFLSDTSSAIIGDFVPIDPVQMASRKATAEGSKSSFGFSSKPVPVMVAANRFEFEPPSPHDNAARQTTFTDFIKSQEATATPRPRSAHMKNSRSEGNAIYMTQKSSHLTPPANQANNTIHRSESSPNVVPLRFPPRRNASPSPDLIQYYTEAETSPSPTRRGRQISEASTSPFSQDADGKYSSQYPSRQTSMYAQKLQSRSPTRPATQKSLSNSSATTRNFIRSPTKTLDDVSERDEYDVGLPDRSRSPAPKKRSRSPMKKMFGDHGWLGQSPDENLNPKPRPKKSSITENELSGRLKKPSMMGKLKNKFEEFAEKADLSPIRGFRSENEKVPKPSILSISVGPPEQARIYMEVELMLVHTANSFLMNQFSQGRMDVDSIKKTVDLWKSKGRPTVIEFMYDQATQRNLVASNQQNFRFHGDRAGNDTRINSMLYNWKQVANIMAIRTFCNADTVIMKLLFDIDQILELLGAGEPIMLRLQQLRASANEMIRVARHNKDINVASQNMPQGRETRCNAHFSAGTTSHSQSAEDSYGGLKLVPDSYVD